MHHIYRTHAFVLSSFPHGESGKRLTLLTKELGVIRAVIEAVRRTESKLRYSVQDYSLLEVDLVSGKGGWRMTNAVIDKNLYHQLEKDKFKILAKVFSLIERMIPAEESNEKIFNIVVSMIDDLEKVDVENIEVQTVLKILHELGYVEDMKVNNREEAIDIINRAIQESQL